MAKMLKVNEAARELGVSEAWLRRADGRASIPKARLDINGWRVYSRDDIEALQAVLWPAISGEGRNKQGGAVAEGSRT